MKPLDEELAILSQKINAEQAIRDKANGLLRAWSDSAKVHTATCEQRLSELVEDIRNETDYHNYLANRVKFPSRRSFRSQTAIGKVAGTGFPQPIWKPSSMRN